MIEIITGQRFVRLTVIRKTTKLEATRKSFICRCDCGKEVLVRKDHLVSGHTTSCGCLQREHILRSITRHGFAGTRIYVIWQDMKQRCNNPLNTAFKYYGGLGVRICEDWLVFEKFRKWALDNGYSDSLTIDRIDSKKGYEPDNCRWITQSENTRRAHFGIKRSNKGKKRMVVNG